MNKIINHIIQTAQTQPNEVFLENSVQKVSWREFFEQFEQKLGNFRFIQKNEIIAIATEQGINSVQLILSIWAKGGIAMPINPNSNTHEIERKLQKVACEKIIVATKIPDLDENFQQIIISDLEKTNRNSEIMLTESENALILFTSGSTNESKAVIFTFENLLASANSFIEYFNANSSDSWLLSLPIFHIGGFMIIFRTILAKSTLFFPLQIQNKSILEAIGKFKPSFISVVNPTLSFLEKSDFTKYQNLKGIFAGGGPITENTISEMIEKGIPVFKVYGSTETTSMITILSPKDFINKKKSAGNHFANVKIFISDESEIVVEAKQIARYFEEENREQKFYTNDIGKIDEDGFLFIEGRISEFIISGGVNINLNKIEKVIKNCKQIKDCAVLGISDNYWGEKLVAVLEIEDRFEMELLQKILIENLDKWEIPKELIIINELPKTELGKIDKKSLKQLF